MNLQMESKKLDLAKYLVSVSFSSAANSASALAVYWYVLKTTGRVSMLVMTGILQSLPAIFAMIISTFANKKGSRFLLSISDLLRAIVLIFIALVCNSNFGLWVAIGGNVILQILEQLRTSATTTIIPDLVEDTKKVSFWVGISNATNATFELVGISISGIIFDNLGYSVLFWLIAASFLIASLTARALKTNIVVNEENDGITLAGSLSTTLRTIKSTALLGVIILAAIANTIFAPLDFVLTAFVHSVLNKGATVYGFIDGGLAGGMILGSLLFGVVAGKWKIKKIVFYGFLLCGLTFFGLAITRNWEIAIFEVGLLGAFMAFIDSSLDSWLLDVVPENYRITMFTIITSMFTLASPIGSAIFGFVLNTYGSPTVLILMAVFILLGVLISINIKEEKNRKM